MFFLSSFLPSYLPASCCYDAWFSRSVRAHDVYTDLHKQSSHVFVLLIPVGETRHFVSAQ
jgi:hypothetical protein